MSNRRSRYSPLSKIFPRQTHDHALTILCLHFRICFSRFPLIIPPRVHWSTRFDRALHSPCCIVPHFVHARQSRLLSMRHPRLPSPFFLLIDIPFFSQIRFHWVFSSECRRSSRRRRFHWVPYREEETRHDENVCVCVNRVEFELILITSREVVLLIFGADSDGVNKEDGVWKSVDKSDSFANIMILKRGGCRINNLWLFFVHSKWILLKLVIIFR